MKIEKPGQHLDHMLRGTRWHHVQLSSMADMKANMLLTMSAVVITLSVPHVFERATRWPFLILIAFCLVTISLAAYAVMPKIRPPLKGEAKPDINSPDFNLLFFGDFTRLSYPQFESAMEEILNDPSRTYQAQVRELYTLGRFLVTKKYCYLRLAYVSFIAGVSISFLLLLGAVFKG